MKRIEMIKKIAEAFNDEDKMEAFEYILPRHEGIKVILQKGKLKLDSENIEKLIKIAEANDLELSAVGIRILEKETEN